MSVSCKCYMYTLKRGHLFCSPRAHQEVKEWMWQSANVARTFEQEFSIKSTHSLVPRGAGNETNSLKA